MSEVAEPVRSAALPIQADNTESKEDVFDEGRIYEVGYLLVSSVVESDVSREVTALKDILEKEKVGFISEEFPKLRALAYPMRKHIGGAWQTFSNGYFGWIKFECSPESAKRIDLELRHNASLLRYLLIKTIRETVLVGAKPPRSDAPRVKREAPTEAAPSAPVSEVELDKSIEKLIAE